VAVGGAETEEFHRQSDEYCRVFGGHGRKVERYSEPDVDHFDILNRLSDQRSRFFAKTMALIPNAAAI
jgi:arylformamidase